MLTHDSKYRGFAEEVRKRKAIWQDGKWLDGVFMAIVEDEVMPLHDCLHPSRSNCSRMSLQWYESKERKESEASNA